MSEVALVEEILRQVLGATRTITKRFAPIVSAEDFVSSEAGLEKLDAICMQLIDCDWREHQAPGQDNWGYAVTSLSAN